MLALLLAILAVVVIVETLRLNRAIRDFERRVRHLEEIERTRIRERNFSMHRK